MHHLIQDKFTQSQIVDLIDPRNTSSQDALRYTSDFYVVSQSEKHFEFLFMVNGLPIPEQYRQRRYVPLGFSLKNSGYQLNLTRTIPNATDLFLFDQGFVVCYSNKTPGFF